MIQKKICMVGVFGTGKTCLVQQFVHSIFNVKYLTTVGVKIDRKDVKSGDQDVRLMLWDLEGRDNVRDVNGTYLRGAHGIIYVGDGTRRETVDQIFEIRDANSNSVLDIPSVIALNKIDLVSEWQLTPEEEKTISSRGLPVIRTSAKTGTGVEEIFQSLADSLVSA